MSFFRDLGMMFGREPQKPKHKTDAADVLHGRKRGRGVEIQELIEEIAAAQTVHTWRNRRWAVLVGVNLLFTASFWLDVQLVEGSLTASRFLGFHMADIYSSFLVGLAQHHIPINLVIGAMTVFLLWGLIGGRAYCSWVCPYHLVAEWAEMLHLKLADRGIVFDHPMHRGIRSVADAEDVLNKGADKISINSPALENPQLIDDLAKRFGSQCVVLGVDSREQENDYHVYQNTGDPGKMSAAARRTVDWIVEAQQRGIGEIVLNCMNQDGVREGYDNEQLQLVRSKSCVPLIASGGAGTMQHFVATFQVANVDGALAASVFHSAEIHIGSLKKFLAANAVDVRLVH